MTIAHTHLVCVARDGVVDGAGKTATAVCMPATLDCDTQMQVNILGSICVLIIIAHTHLVCVARKGVLDGADKQVAIARMPHKPNRKTRKRQIQSTILVYTL
jgi:hypothetical protein